MALQKTLSLTNNFGEQSVFQNAYIKVHEVIGGKHGASICLMIMNNANGKELKREMLSFMPSVADGSENFIKQAYEYVKTLSEFEGATNC